MYKIILLLNPRSVFEGFRDSATHILQRFYAAFPPFFYYSGIFNMMIAGIP